MQELPAEILVAIVLSFDSKTIARFSCVNHALRDLVHDERFAKQWLMRQPFPFAMKAVAEKTLFAREADPSATFRFVNNAIVAANTVGRTIYHSLPYNEEGLRAFFLTPDKPRPWWYLLWAACLTNDWRLAHAIFHGYGLHILPYREEKAEFYHDPFFHGSMEKAEVYYDLLFRHGRWQEACDSLFWPLSSARWYTSRVPEEWRKLLFSGGPGKSPSTGQRFRRYPNDDELTEKSGSVLVEERDRYVFRIATSPALSARMLVVRLCKADRNAAAVVAAFALRARGVSIREFKRTTPDTEKVYRLWSELCKKYSHPPISLTKSRALFMREGLGDDDLSPLFALLEHSET